MTSSTPVYICGAAAISSWGFVWQEMGEKLLTAQNTFTPTRQLSAFTGSDSKPVLGSEIPEISKQYDVEPRARKFMSYPARLAAVALKMMLAEVNWSEQIRQEAAFYLGVGASGASMIELDAMLNASIQNQQFSLTDFGAKAINACNPLFAFQLMNNFTLCHAAILHGISGPNSAFYSRGTGTVAALQEACWQIVNNTSQFAIAGGADSALHPLTWAQLFQTSQIIPGEGAALLALSRQKQSALAELVTVDYVSDFRQAENLLSQIAGCEQQSCFLLAPANHEKRDFLQQAIRHFSCPRYDLSLLLGEALAATPALAWCCALALLMQNTLPVVRIFVLSAGLDNGVGLVEIRRLA